MILRRALPTRPPAADLRTCLGSVYSVSRGCQGRRPGPGCEAAGHEPDHGPLDHRLGMLGKAFVVTGQAAGAHQPGVGPLDDPSSGEDLEDRSFVGAFDDLDQDPEVVLGERQELAGIAPIGPDQHDRGRLHLRSLQHQSAAVAVLQPGAGHHHDDQQAEGVGHDVSLASVDLLARVIAAGPLADGVGTLHALGVHDARAGHRVAPVGVTNRIT